MNDFIDLFEGDLFEVVFDSRQNLHSICDIMDALRASYELEARINRPIFGNWVYPASVGGIDTVTHTFWRNR